MLFYLIVLFFMDLSWAYDGVYKFNGSDTNCDDSEIEKYFLPGQSWEYPIWQEYVKMTVLGSGAL